MSIAEVIQSVKGLLGAQPSSTPTQRLFEEWLSETLNISLDDARERYARSRRAFLGGHKGRGYRQFNNCAYEALQVFFTDTPREAMAAYRHHAPMHFLMMLGYEEPTWTERDPVIKALRDRPRGGKVAILDFGCGLAQKSRTLAKYLQAQGTEVQLYLADIPTVRKDFLVWLTARTGIPMTFLDCSLEVPIPTLPEIDVLFATEFFEHVHDPLAYFDRFDEQLSPSGLMITNLDDHHQEFMHVTPDLGPLRERVRARGYQSLQGRELFRKSASPSEPVLRRVGNA
jgi:hypothetical protein